MLDFSPRANGTSILSCLAVLLAAATAPAQGTTQQSPTAHQAPPSLLAKFDVTVGTVQSLQVGFDAGGGYSIPVLIGGVVRTMSLHEHDLRAPGFQLLVEDATGVHQVPTPACVTFRGMLLEQPTTAIVATIIDDSVTAIIYEEPAMPGTPGRNWVVQPVREVEPTAGPAAHLVYLATDSAALPFQCGNGPALPGTTYPPIGVDATFECDIAIEADQEFYAQNGNNVTATQNDITSVMNQVEFIYNRDCDLQYAISTILVTTTAVYTTNDAGSLLNQFAGRWNSINAGIPRDVAHLFTGRNLTGGTIGIATLASICNLGNAYGLSQSRFTTNFTQRVGLTSHEVGHNWSAQHCDASNPCYIMCSGLGGCNGNVTLFSPLEQGQITGFAATRNCLNQVIVVPTITGANPTSVTVFNPGSVTLSGSGFSGATSYRVGSQTFTSGFSVPNDGAINIQIPQGTAPGFTTVSVTNSAGTSNSWVVQYLITSPPKLKTTTSVPGTGGLATFSFGGTPGRPWIFVFGFSNATTPFQGFNLLSNPIILTAGTFVGPSGIDGFTIPVPGGLGLLFIYSQILEADPVTPTATGVSNIGITILLP